MQLVPEDYDYDLTNDLEPGWQTMEALKQWEKEVPTRDSSGTVTYFVVEFGSVDNEKTETIEWSVPRQWEGTRSRMGKLMRVLFPDQSRVKSLSEVVGKRCEVNLQENEKGFLHVAEVRAIEERTSTRRRSTK